MKKRILLVFTILFSLTGTRLYAENPLPPIYFRDIQLGGYEVSVPTQLFFYCASPFANGL
ncbi:MAG: hypothetical protein LBO74_03515 [Candidatus Symbiothrix sp.]|nr:hypothetical protein [Candidatus Symbiothrix sp.]